MATVSVVRHSHGRAAPTHAHAHAFITLLLRGSYREHVGGEWIDYRPLTAVYHPSGLVHHEVIGEGGADVLAVDIAPPLLGGLARTPLGLGSVQELSGGALVWQLLAVYADLPHAARSPIAIEEPLAEIVSAIHGGSARPLHREPSWLHEVERLLDGGFRQPLSLTTLALEAGVHPVHLSRVYRRARGRSLRDHVHRLRLLEAARLIETPGRTLADVAVAVGFCDLSHLTSVCRRLTSQTPAHVRRRLDPRPHRATVGHRRLARAPHEPSEIATA